MDFGKKYINFIGRWRLDLPNFFEELKYLKTVCFTIFLLGLTRVHDLWKILTKMIVKIWPTSLGEKMADDRSTFWNPGSTIVRSILFYNYSINGRYYRWRLKPIFNIVSTLIVNAIPDCLRSTMDQRKNTTLNQREISASDQIPKIKHLSISCRCWLATLPHHWNSVVVLAVIIVPSCWFSFLDSNYNTDSLELCLRLNYSLLQLSNCHMLDHVVYIYLYQFYDKTQRWPPDNVILFIRGQTI